MYKENKLNSMFNLKGNFLRGFFVISAKHGSFLLFILSSFLCLYFLVFDTSVLSSFGVFANIYIHSALCAFAVIENLTLFLIYIGAKLKCDCFFFFEKRKSFSFSLMIKAAVLYFIIGIKKLFSFCFFILPTISVMYVLFKSIQSGMSYILLAISILCGIILFISGIYSYSVYLQKFAAAAFVFSEYPEAKIKAVIYRSAELMNGKCRKLFFLKILNLPKRIFSILLLPAVYYLPYCKAVESDFILQKEIPYMRKRAHTEKTVVFYLGPIKEN